MQSTAPAAHAVDHQAVHFLAHVRVAGFQRRDRSHAPCEHGRFDRPSCRGAHVGEATRLLKPADGSQR